MKLQEDIVIAVGTLHMRFHMAGLVAVVVEVVGCNTAGFHTDSVDTDSVGRLAYIEVAAKVKGALGNHEVQTGVDSLAAW